MSDPDDKCLYSEINLKAEDDAFRRRHRFDESRFHPSNRLANLKRRVDRARKFPGNTCAASRHLHMIALALAAGRPYPMLQEDPKYCAGTMLAVLESLWKARAALKVRK